TEQSAKSHGLTMHDPLRVKLQRPGWYAVSGTPADSVYFALNHLCPTPPRAVISGINSGGNIGNDVHYSGTVAAAREAALSGVPALAVSLATEVGGSEKHWQTAGALAAQVLERMLATPMPAGIVLNLNVPNRPMSEIVGLVCAPMGDRAYNAMVREDRDPRGKPYYWIGGPPIVPTEESHTDCSLVARGYATLTPLLTDVTAHRLMEQVGALLK
ncbi:MAG: 5'-nucleotidase, partial [Myxococcota bacterium]